MEREVLVVLEEALLLEQFAIPVVVVLVDIPEQVVQVDVEI
jgi:hypothetical protein